MRPIELILTAFGPYRNREVIDFRHLQDHRLFVISGNTGAGKTTIFDAVCFALYGSASGEDRAETRNLRSQFADEATHMSVDLRFMVKDKQYRVFRQMKHRKGNNKSETGERIELYEITSTGEVPAVDRFVIRDVDMKLSEIIGLSKDQFSQIVMLPQGEFRKLLTSSTDNKEDILRKIFRTERFEVLEQIVGNQYKTMQEQFKLQQGSQLSTIGHIADHLPMREGSQLSATFAQEQHNLFQVLAGLKEEQVHYEDELQRLEQRKIDHAELLSSARRELHEAEQSNSKLHEYEQKQQEQANLLEQQEYYEALQHSIKQGERALFVSAYESRFERAKQLLEERQRQYELQKQRLQEVKLLDTKTQQRYAEQELQQEVRKQLELEVHELQQLLPLVDQYGVAKRELQNAYEQEHQFQSKLQETETYLQQMKEKKLLLQQQLQNVDQQSQQALQLQTQLIEIERQGKLISRMLEYAKELLLMEQQKHMLTELAGASKMKLERLEQLWIDGQASELARHLHDGQPCPVCGSEQHPQKVAIYVEVPTRALIDNAKNEQMKRDQELLSWQANRSAKQELMQQQFEQLSESLQLNIQASLQLITTEELSKLQQQLEQEQQLLRKSWKQGKDQYDQLKVILEQTQIQKQELQHVEQELEQRELQRGQYQQLQQQAALQKASLLSRVEQLEHRIPEELRSSNSLQQQLVQKQELHTQLEQQWKQIVDAKADAQRTLAAVLAQVEQTAQGLEEYGHELTQSETEFAAQLLEAGFESSQEYREAKLSKLQIEEKTASFVSYRDQLARLSSQIELLAQAVVGKVLVDCLPLKVKLAELQEQFEVMIALEGQANHYINEIRQYQSKLQGNSEQLLELEQSLSLLADLYTTMKGDNPLKLSFERYILIDYLEQILVMANIRLADLSNGQFELQRSDRLETHGKQSGLGLDVYDAYTGQNRDVKSLSGGEKFNAALCLALGMTDVIQSHQGGVSIEMMFIDEGFGSLDEESLQKAIQTLIDLEQAGRMIGVISHVQELKDALPACLEVMKNRDGHSQTRFVLK